MIHQARGLSRYPNYGDSRDSVGGASGNLDEERIPDRNI